MLCVHYSFQSNHGSHQKAKASCSKEACQWKRTSGWTPFLGAESVNADAGTSFSNWAPKQPPRSNGRTRHSEATLHQAGEQVWVVGVRRHRDLFVVRWRFGFEFNFTRFDLSGMSLLNDGHLLNDVVSIGRQNVM